MATKYRAVIYEYENGKFVKVNAAQRPNNANFLIQSHGGAYDWSGFRTIAEIEEQLPSLEGTHEAGFYMVVEV